MELIFGILGGVALGGFFGAFGMAVWSGRAYDKGHKDGEVYGYIKGWNIGYEDAYVDQAVADEVIFNGENKTQIEGD